MIGPESGPAVGDGQVQKAALSLHDLALLQPFGQGAAGQLDIILIFPAPGQPQAVDTVIQRQGCGGGAVQRGTLLQHSMALQHPKQLLHIVQGERLRLLRLNHAAGIGSHRRQAGDPDDVDGAVVLFQQLALTGDEPAALGAVHRSRRHPLRHPDYQAVWIVPLDGHAFHIGQLGADGRRHPAGWQGYEVVADVYAGGVDDLLGGVAHIAGHLDGVYPEKDHAGHDDRRSRQQNGQHLVKPAEPAPSPAGPFVSALSCHGITSVLSCGPAMGRLGGACFLSLRPLRSANRASAGWIFGL